MAVVKPLTLALLVVGAAFIGMIAGAASLSIGGIGPQEPPPCDFGDLGCQAARTLTDVIAPYILPLIILLAAIFVLPKAGPKGVVLALIVIGFVVLWYVGVPGYVPPFREVFF